MDKINKRYLELAEKWMNGTITPEEKTEFSDWYNKNQDDELVLPDDFAAGKDALGERMLENINNKKLRPASKIKRFNINRFAAAAAVIALIITSAYFLLDNNKNNKPGVVVAEAVTDVIAPSNTKAVITLSNGQKILLDSAGNGTLVSFDKAKIVKNADGGISYVNTKLQDEEMEYNTLDLPRGSKVVNLTLSDGTKVWLNSESRLRFPVVFSKKERRVEISGEAYFEVTKDPRRTFYVISNGVSTEVLGTQFNVNTYTTEAVKKVTLLEGAVKVKSTNGPGVILKPGQQARLSNSIQVISGLDTESEVAWKNGLFSFIKTDMAAIMRQIERWYNVSVEYEDEGLKKKHFTGEIPRSENVSHVLHMLELTNTFHFKIEGRKILITK